LDIIVNKKVTYSVIRNKTLEDSGVLADDRVVVRDPEFGKRVRLLRHRLHLTQQGLGDRLGLTKVSVARYEAGRVPRLDLLQKIAEIAGESVAWLLHGDAANSGTRATQPIRSPATGQRLGRLVTRLISELESDYLSQLPVGLRRRYEQRTKEVLAKTLRELKEYRALLEAECRGDLTRRLKKP
jgi:transcriptional regulator with XRE-family HTH domain